MHYSILHKHSKPVNVPILKNNKDIPKLFNIFYAYKKSIKKALIK